MHVIRLYTKFYALSHWVVFGLFGTLGIGYELSNKDVIHGKALLAELNLGDKINRPFDLLSKGERQNVLIARALISEPEILVLDEPGTGLDVFAREYMLSTVADLATNKAMTIIYVTHYTEEILPIFDRCLLMKNGQIYAKGLTQDLFTTEQISHFLNYPINIIQEQTHFHVSLQVKSHIMALLEGDDDLNG